MKPLQVGIIGGAGYAAGELLRLLLPHPAVAVQFVHSKSHAGRPVAEVHHDLWPQAQLFFTSEIIADVDIVFLCLPHGHAKGLLAEYHFSPETLVVDLSQDFRPRANEPGFVYGLPEINRAAIAATKRIAAPGCFATAVSLSLLPLAAKGLADHPIHVTGVTGSTGAGYECTATTHFSWRSGNIAVYKPFVHQHLAEIKETLISAGGSAAELNFVPMRGGFTRGILVSTYLETSLTEPEALAIYETYYSEHPFTHVIAADVDLKCVINTNHCFLNVRVTHGKIHITGVLDNLLKGAAGQAVQAMNLALGLPEATGLNLKASAF